MATIDSKKIINIGVKEVLQGISTMETPDLEDFFKEVANLLAKRKSNVLSKTETELFLIINKPALSETQEKRADNLYKKLQKEVISKEEQTELGKYIQKQEAYRVKRLQALIELSQIRKISLEQLMMDLGIQDSSKK